jgi:predicted Zn-dependent protease
LAQDSLDLSSGLRHRITDLGLDFLARFYALETRRNPDNVDALAELGQVYTHQRRYQEGLSVDRQLVRLVPTNPTVHYNLACSLALVGRPAEALDALERAMEQGYDDARHMLEDDDLTSLHAEARFHELAARIEQSTA